MTPEVSLLVRAVMLSLLVLGLERVTRSRRAKRAAPRDLVVRLPAIINPVRGTVRSRPVQVSPVQLAAAEARRDGDFEVVRLEPQPHTPPYERAA